jgi:predicted regulator of amino acid metabolism with ACT domain
MRQRSRLEVVQKMIQLGISVDSKERMFIGNLQVYDTALARAVKVDRRVVRNTVMQISGDPELREIFSKIKPVGTSLVEIAGLLGYTVLVISADPYKPGVIAGVADVLADANIVIRQALADDPDMAQDPKLTLVVEGRVPASVLAEIQEIESVRSITILK